MDVYALATPASVATVFLLHDLVPPPLDFNAPLWSIPVEWHIYFTLPYIAWAWRRWGALQSVLGAACLSFLLIGVSHRIGRPCLYFEYYAMFYAGCGAAWISQSTAARAAQYRNLPWPVVSGGLILLFCCFWAGGGAPDFGLHVEDFRVAWALLLAAGLVALAGPQPSRIRDFLSARPLVSVAGFSYSLYLLHWPVLAIISDLWLPVKLPFALHFWLMVVIGLPLSLALAYVSSLIFERPFLRRSARKLEMLQADVGKTNPSPIGVRPARPGRG